MSTTHEAAKKWVEEIAQLCQPDSIYWCNGSQEENDELCNMMVENAAGFAGGVFGRPAPARRQLQDSECASRAAHDGPDVQRGAH